MMESVFQRDLLFLHYICPYRPNYTLLTNLSSMFDFRQMLQWLQEKTNENFVAGSINGFYNNLHTTLSGTNNC